MAASPGSSARSAIPVALHRHQGPDGLRPGPFEWPATALFVDITGFTSLTESLAAHGPLGLEELRTLLNGYFAPLSEIVRDLGGSIVRFEGDAVTAVFDGSDTEIDNNSGRSAGARRAAACALALQRLTTEQATFLSTAGPVVIQTRIGVASGTAVSVLADKQRRLQPIFGGPAIAGAAAAEGRARPGQVVIDATTDRLLAGGATIERIDDDHRLLLDLREPMPSGSPVDPPAIDPARIVHPRVLSRLGLTSRLVDEYRPVSVVFAGVGDGAGRPLTVQALGVEVARIAPIVHDLDGEILTVIAGDKGTSTLIAFGAPTAIDRSAQRAVDAAAALAATIPSRVGIATGPMFCGMIGGPSRAEYTVIGDTANTAARLMQAAAPGEILVDEATMIQVDRNDAFGPVRRLEVKGKLDVVVCAPLTSSAGGTDRLVTSARLIDRDDERARLQRARRRAATGRGRSILLRGPAGVGKSRLIHHLLGHLRPQLPAHTPAGAAGDHDAEPARVLAARFSPVDRSTPYGGLQPLFRAAIGLAPEVAPSAREAAAGLTHLLPDVAQDRISLIEPLVGVSIDVGPIDGGPTHAGRSIDQPGSEHGSDLTRALAVDLLAAAADRPTVLAVDDVHRADRESIELLDQLNRIVPSLPMLAVYGCRDDATVQTDEIIDIGVLAEDDAVALGAELVGSDDALGLVGFAGGNPLALELAATEWGRSPGEGGGSLATLALARIDALPADHRDWFRRASAFVNGFDRETADDVLGPGSLDELVAAGLLEASLSDDSTIYTTRHGFLREAVYETLLPGQRGSLHHQIGDRLEAARRPADVFELAYHFGRTENVEKQRRYFGAAVDAAERAFSFALAAEWGERLVDVAASEQVPALRLRLGRWYTLLGRTDDAERTLRAATAGDDAVRSQALTWLARLSSRAGLGDAAERLLDEAERLAQRSGDLDAIVHRTTVAAEVAQTGANRDDMVAAAQRLLDLAGDDALTAARAHHALGTAAMMFDGDMATARDRLDRAIDLAAERGDLVLQSEIRSDLAGTYYFENRLDVALEQLARAGNDAESIGYRRGVAAMAGNEALIRNRLGDVDGALALMALSADRLLEVGDHAWTLTKIPIPAQAFLLRGDPDAAQHLLVEAVDLSTLADQSQTEAYASHHLARVLLARRSFDEAAAANRRAAEVAERIGYGQIGADIAVLDVRLLAARGDVTAALAGLDRLAGDAGPPLMAQIEYERWRVDPTPERATTATEAYQLLHAATPTAQTARRLTAITGVTHDAPPVAANERQGPAPTVGFFGGVLATVRREMERLRTETTRA